jgi:hypothetical protein
LKASLAYIARSLKKHGGDQLLAPSLFQEKATAPLGKSSHLADAGSSRGRDLDQELKYASKSAASGSRLKSTRGLRGPGRTGPARTGDAARCISSTTGACARLIPAGAEGPHACPTGPAGRRKVASTGACRTRDSSGASAPGSTEPGRVRTQSKPSASHITHKMARTGE